MTHINNPVVSGPLAYFASGGFANYGLQFISIAQKCMLENINTELCTEHTFLVYNTATNTTRTLAPQPIQSRYFYAMTVLSSGDVLMCGGFHPLTDTNRILADCTQYSVAANVWSPFGAPLLPVPIYGMTMVTLYSPVGHSV